MGFAAHFFIRDWKRSMVDAAEILLKIKTIAEPIVQAEGMELIDIQYRREHRGRVLRLFIDREGGVTVEDCAAVSHEVEKNLDIYDIPPGPYTLEVSSPGLNRPLKKAEDFLRFRNHQIKVRTVVPIEERRTFKGRLLGCRDDLVEIEWEKGVVRIPLTQIAKANLECEF